MVGHNAETMFSTLQQAVLCSQGLNTAEQMELSVAMWQHSFGQVGRFYGDGSTLSCMPCIVSCIQHH
jgi:hypothetical protein